MKKLRVMVDIEIDEESCIIAGIKEQELADNLTAYADDAVDGAGVLAVEEGVHADSCNDLGHDPAGQNAGTGDTAEGGVLAFHQVGEDEAQQSLSRNGAKQEYERCADGLYHVLALEHLFVVVKAYELQILGSRAGESQVGERIVQSHEDGRDEEDQQQDNCRPQHPCLVDHAARCLSQWEALCYT